MVFALLLLSINIQVGIATGYRLRVLVRSRILSSRCRPDWLWAHPASYPMGNGDLSPGVKLPGRGA
jgi:hypothetical protein